MTRRAWDRLGLTGSGGTVLGLAAVGWVLARLAGSRAALLMTDGMVVAVVLVWVLERRPVAVGGRRSDVPARVTVGQPFEVAIELRTRRRTSELVVEDPVPDALGPSGRVVIPTLVGGQTRREVYRLVPTRRGVFTIGPLRVIRRDALGLTRRASIVAGPATIVVHPLVELVADRVVSRAWQDPPVRVRASRSGPSGFELGGLRDYVTGDDPRRIAWRASARTIDRDTGAIRYVVQELEMGITDRVSIVLDTDARRHSPGDPSTSFETAVAVAASIAVHHLHEGFSVSLETSRGQLLPAQRGRRARVRVLDALAGVATGGDALTGALRRLAVARGSAAVHTVVITPFVVDRDAGQLRLLLRRGAALLLVHVGGEAIDSESLRRATAVGCPVVEVEPGQPLTVAFGRVAWGGRR